MGQVLVTYNDGSTTTMDEGLAEQQIEDGSYGITNTTPVTNPTVPNGTITSPSGQVTGPDNTPIGQPESIPTVPSPPPISKLPSAPPIAPSSTPIHL